MRSNRAQQIVLALFLIAMWPLQIASAAEPMPLRASYSSIGGAFAPLWLAQDKGLFTKYGLAVELKYILSATGTQALFSGSIDIVNPATEIVEAGLGGQRVAFIIGILNRAVLSVYSKAEFRQLTDLRGKVISMDEDVGRAFDTGLSWKYDGKDPDADRPGAVRLVLRMSVDRATGYAA